MPVPPRPAAASRPLLRDEAFARIKDAVLDGTLQPGEALKDDELAGWLGISRTPIRQAVARLVSAGLVEVVANRYTRVAQAHPALILEYLEIAVTMWQVGARFALPLMDEASRGAVVAGFDEAVACCDRAEVGGDPAEVVASVHSAFRAMPLVAGNDVLLATLDDAELGLTYQVGLTQALFDYPTVRDGLRAARAAVVEDDAEAFVMAAEAFLETVGAELVARATESMPSPEPAPVSFPGRRLLADEAYDRLLAAITDGRLPAGERLNDADLAQRLSISRTPLRQAIERLADEGLVVLEANKSAHVAPADPRVLFECSQVVSALHRRSIARELPRADDATVEGFVRQVRALLDQLGPEGDVEDLAALRVAVQHLAEYFTLATGNHELKRVVARLGARIAFLTRSLGRQWQPAAIRRYLEESLVAASARDGVETARALRRLAFGDALLEA